MEISLEGALWHPYLLCWLILSAGVSQNKQMILTIEMDSLVLTEGDEAEIRLRIHGITSKINSYTFRLEYEMTSKFRKQRMRKKKNIVWNPQEGDSITLSEMITECDSYHIQICSVSWEDLTGMYKVKKEFNKQNKPILGICAGIQELNVIFGGTLFQSIPNHNLKDQSKHNYKYRRKIHFL